MPISKSLPFCVISSLSNWFWDRYAIRVVYGDGVAMDNALDGPFKANDRSRWPSLVGSVVTRQIHDRGVDPVVALCV